MWQRLDLHGRDVVFLFTVNTDMTTRITDETVIPKNAVFIPYILAVSPYTEAERAAAALIIPTNAALPMDPDIVRSEDKRAVASATYFLSTREVPHVISGIIRQPMDTDRITLKIERHPNVSARIPPMVGAIIGATLTTSPSHHGAFLLIGKDG